MGFFWICFVFFLFCFFSLLILRKNYNSITSVLQSKICRSVKRYISKNSSKRPVFSECWLCEVLYPNKKTIFYLLSRKKKSRNTVRLPNPPTETAKNAAKSDESDLPTVHYLGLRTVSPLGCIVNLFDFSNLLFYFSICKFQQLKAECRV